MARKGVFSRALQAAQDAEARLGGEGKKIAPNVKYFGASFEEQMRRTAQDLDPAQIGMGPLPDRLDPGENIDDLVASIRESGQQVPVLVRKTAAGLEAVYGRRRILACRELGVPVLGIVSEMTDAEALLAQGLENAARLDNSYIERALFAMAIELDTGDSALAGRALGVDKTQLSRMRTIVRDVPREVIAAIGPAHGAGRRPWEDLRARLTEGNAPDEAQVLALIDAALPSAERLTALLARLKQPAARVPASKRTRQLVPGVEALRKSRSLTLRTADASTGEFMAFVETQIPALYEAWKRQKG